MQARQGTGRACKEGVVQGAFVPTLKECWVFRGAQGM